MPDFHRVRGRTTRDSDAAPRPRTSSMTAFRVLWLGQLLSSIGSPFQVIAIAMWALDSGRGASTLSIIVAAGTVSQLIGTLISGPLVDRIGALRTILYCDVIRCGLAGILAAALLLRFDTLVIIGIVSVSSTVGGIFLPALRSAPGELLSREDQPRGNGLMEVSKSSSMLIGSLAGGLFVAFTGPVVAIIVNASSFAIGAVCAWIARRRYGLFAYSTATPEPMIALVRAGLAVVWRTTWLRTLLFVDAGLDLVTAGQLSVGLPAISYHMSGASSFGLMLAGFGGGTLVGALLAGRLEWIPVRPIRMVFLVQLLAAPFLGVLPWVNLPTVVACLALAGALNGVASVYYVSIIQRNVDVSMLGRVMALLVAAGMCVQPIGQMLFGLLIDHGWIRESFGAGTVIMVMICILGIARRDVGRLA